MTFTIKLERLDGAPADPPSFETTVLAWSPGDTIPLSAGRTLQVVRLRYVDAEELPVLVVSDDPEDAHGAHSALRDKRLREEINDGEEGDDEPDHQPPPLEPVRHHTTP